jgi:general secretion pathway protein G
MAVSSRRGSSAFTIPELLITIAIISVLALIAFPAYSDYKEKVKVKKAISDIAVLGTLIQNYYLDSKVYPPNLAAAGVAGSIDPWGRPYAYTNLQDAKGKGKARKNKSLVPINSDFDLYSLGKDGDSSGPLTAKNSRDDVIRANDGAYIGLASNYE